MTDRKFVIDMREHNMVFPAASDNETVEEFIGRLRVGLRLENVEELEPFIEIK